MVIKYITSVFCGIEGALLIPRGSLFLVEAAYISKNSW